MDTRLEKDNSKQFNDESITKLFALLNRRSRTEAKLKKLYDKLTGEKMGENVEVKMQELNYKFTEWNTISKSMIEWSTTNPLVHVSKYLKIDKQEWMEREGIVILLTEVMVDLIVGKNEQGLERIFDDYLYSSSVSTRAVQCTLVRLFTSVSERVGRGWNCWKGHRVVCWLVGWMVDRWRYEWNDETIDCVVNYLVKVIEECEDMEMVKWTILAGERWWVEMKMKNSERRRDRLRTALTRHSTQTETLVGTIDLDAFDVERYQVGWCARWCEDNLVEGCMEEIQDVKLSLDRFEARNVCRSPVRSSFPVKSIVYFYEIICVTNGEIVVGWSTTETRVYPDEFVFTLKVCNNLRQNDNRHTLPTTSSLRPLNVIGCLLDMDNKRFEFYLNGRALDCPTPQYFSPPYFATAYLTPHQQIHFNFGQCLFKFPPRNIRFTTFHEQTGGDERKYRLGVTKMLGHSAFWFADTSVDNKVSLFFDDEMQNEVNREVRRVERDIENDRDVGEWRAVVEGMKEGWRGVRYIQSIIEVTGNVGGSDKVDVMAQWVGRVVEDVIDWTYKEKLLELLNPYLQLVITHSSLTQHRSICIVLLNLIKCCRHYAYKFLNTIHPLIFTYLTRTLTSSPDQWTQLFVLIALADLELSEHEKRQIEGCAKIGQILDTCRKTFEGKDVARLIKSESKHRINYQLYLCYNQLFRSLNIGTSTSTTPATLNPIDHSQHLSLSPCHLSARSDWHWQSVRSVCQVSAHIYYFEVVLLTAGPMTIGWATKRTDLAKYVVGGDEFSVGFNGYDRTIWNDNKEHPVSNVPRWRPGDVVGCLLDHANQKFTFFLNGFCLLILPNIYFSTLPYHTCVSLSPHQQVYFNFGQTAFQYPPKRIDFRDFSLNPPKEPTPSKPTISLQNVTVTSSLFTFDSQVNTEDINIITQPSTSNSQLTSNSLKRSSSVTLCDICQQPQSTKRLRFECCDHLKFCLNCAHVLGNCRKCLAEKLNNFQN